MLSLTRDYMRQGELFGRLKESDNALRTGFNRP